MGNLVEAEWLFTLFTEFRPVPDFVCRCDDPWTNHQGFSWNGPPFDGMDGHIPTVVTRRYVQGFKVVAW